jgi:N-acetylglucosamine-6-phosphate deacetylase
MSGLHHAIIAPQLFDGAAVRNDMAVLIDGARIAAVFERAQLPAAIPVRELPPGALLAPGFIDIQVNGGGDVLFNDDPTAHGARAIAAAHRRLGTTAILPTFISDTPDKMTAALAAVDSMIAADPSVLGIHLEGPFLSHEKAGVHDRRVLRQPTAQDIEAITARRRGVTLVTLAPERVPERFIATLAAAGVRVSLGHSMATYAQTKMAMAQGLRGFTHLFNAMRALDAREPGPIAAALDSPEACYGMIADGIHVAPAMLRLAMRGAGQPILVSDAMPPVGGKRSSFALYGELIVVREGRCARANGTLAGAYLCMASAVRHCVNVLNIGLADALRFASTHPAQFLGLGNTYGELAPGYRADMVALDGTTLDVIATWIAGASIDETPPPCDRDWSIA